MKSSILNYINLKKELTEEYDNRNSYAQIKKKIAKKNGVIFEESKPINLSEDVVFEYVKESEKNESKETIDIVDDIIESEIIEDKQEEIKEQTTVTTIVEPVFNIPPQLAYELYRHKKEIERLQKELEFLRDQQVQYQSKVVPPFFGGPSGGGELNLLKPVHTVVDYDILGSGGKDLILCDTRENDIVITLPQASKNNGFIAHVKKMHRNNQLYIRGFSETELIDEQVQIVINTIYVTLQIACDGYNWYIV